MDKRIRNAAIAAVIASVAVILIIVVGLNFFEKGTFFSWGDQQPATGTDEAIQPNGAADTTENLANVNKDFLSDSTFLDEYQPHANEERDNAKEETLSLLTSSVERDLRVTVIDESGIPVTGITFYINVKGAGEYKDLDGDGIIYVGGLKPGEYYVSLNKVDGYEVPETEVPVTVKDRIEYAMISDISYLVKTEAEINAEEEDTKINDAFSDADETEKTSAWKDAAGATLGIDVSKWNKEIDWQAVSDAGVKFAIIRCGYRGSKTGALVEDPYFYRNLTGAKEAGIDVGIYFFTQAVNEMEAVEEASMVLSLINGETLDYPVFIDTEGANGRADNIDVTTRTTVCDAFCKTIESAGLKAGIYASRNWFYTKLQKQDLTQYQIWLAEYRSEPLYTGRYDMWQYTSQGSIDGIEGRVDLDLAY